MGNSCVSIKKNENHNNHNSLIKWQAAYKTCRYHWWPMVEIKENDAINNLYAVGGDYGEDTCFGD